MENLMTEAVKSAISNEFAKEILESEKYGSSLTGASRDTMIQLFENTQADVQKQLTEGTLTSDIAQFTPILLPMVRRIYPQLIANELLGVQPMSMPTGYMYALVNQYLGDGLRKVDDRTRPAGVVYTVSASDASAIEAGIVDGSIIPGTTKILNSDGDAVGTLLYIEKDIQTNVVGAEQHVGTKLLATIDIDAVSSADLVLGAGETFDLGNATGLTVKATYSNESSFAHILKNYTGPYSTVDAEHLGDEMREIGFSIAKKSIEAQSRALKAKYTVEAFQDLNAQHGLNMDSELMSVMQYEIQAELDREIVSFVKNNSQWLPDMQFGSQTNVQIPDGRWEIERYRAQAIRIDKESVQIGLDTKRGQGNILLVSPKVCTMLEQVGSFHTAPISSSVTQPISGGVAGTFNNKYKVVVDQYAEDDFCTVLYKGANNKDAMGMFCPYVPLSFTKVTDYVTGQPVIIAKTRYALDTIPGVVNPKSNDRAKSYARSFGVNFANTILA